MPDYLSKEEIKQWRSSLEKITLEEYAARLGKVLEEDKHTNDIVDIVMKSQPVVTRIDESSTKKEKINTIGEKAFAREKEISTKANSNNTAKSMNHKKVGGTITQKTEMS